MNSVYKNSLVVLAKWDIFFVNILWMLYEGYCFFWVELMSVTSEFWVFNEGGDSWEPWASRELGCLLFFFFFHHGETNSGNWRKLPCSLLSVLEGEVRSIPLFKEKKVSWTDRSGCWLDLSVAYLTRKFQQTAWSSYKLVFKRKVYFAEWIRLDAY